MHQLVGREDRYSGKIGDVRLDLGIIRGMESGPVDP